MINYHMIQLIIIVNICIIADVKYLFYYYVEIYLDPMWNVCYSNATNNCITITIVVLLFIAISLIISYVAVPLNHYITWSNNYFNISVP